MITLPILYVFKELKPHHVAQIAYNENVPTRSEYDKNYERLSKKISKEKIYNIRRNENIVKCCEIVNNISSISISPKQAENPILNDFFKNLPNFSAFFINNQLFIQNKNKETRNY